eukprot:scaffold3045_cov179-Ochromonas_danica.AAC.9
MKRGDPVEKTLRGDLSAAIVGGQHLQMRSAAQADVLCYGGEALANALAHLSSIANAMRSDTAEGISRLIMRDVVVDVREDWELAEEWHERGMRVRQSEWRPYLGIRRE